MAQKLPIQKALYEQNMPLTGPLNNFRGLKTINFKNYSQKGVKKHKKNLFNISLTGPKDGFYFFDFFHWFCPLLIANSTRYLQIYVVHWINRSKYEAMLYEYDLKEQFIKNLFIGGFLNTATGLSNENFCPAL
jgi:hypothetical protein